MKQYVFQRLGLLSLLSFVAISIVILPSVGASTDSRVLENELLVTRRSGALVYFAYEDDHELQVYDLAAQRWLPSIDLGDSLSAFDVDEEGIYAAFGRRLARFDLDGSNEAHLTNSAKDVTYLHVFDSFLAYGWFDYPANEVTTLSKVDGTFIDYDYSSYNDYSKSVKNIALRRIYGFTSASSSSVVQLSIDEFGNIIEDRRGGHSGYYSDRLYLTPDEGQLVDGSGGLYLATDVTENGELSFPDYATDIAFYGNLPLVLNGNLVVAYSNRHEESGRHTLSSTPVAIEVYDSDLFIFNNLSQGSIVNTLPISTITSDNPDNALDASTLDFEPDFIQYNNGIVYSYSQKYRSIFRYDLAERRYLEPVNVRFSGNHMTYLPSTDAFLSAHNAGQTNADSSAGPGMIDVISADGQNVQYGVVDSNDAINGVAAVDTFIVTCRKDYATGDDRYVVEDMTGQEIASYDVFSCHYKQSEWNADTRHMYVASTISSDVLAIDVNGRVEEIDNVNLGPVPIRLLDNNTRLISGSGKIWDSTTFMQVDALPHAIVDAAWYAGGLYTLQKNDYPNTTLQKWTDELTLDLEVQVAGKPLYMQATPDGLLVVTNWLGKLRYSVWGEQLDLISGSALNLSLLPSVVRDYCSGSYSDDFSNPASGWPTLDSGIYSADYYNGVYRLLHRESGYWTAFSRGDVWDQGDLLQIEGEVVSGNAVWGVIFGLNYDWGDFYTFEIIPVTEQYFLLHYSSDSGWSFIDSGSSGAIRTYGTNTITLAQTHPSYPDNISFAINGTNLFQRSVPAGRVGLTGGSFAENTEIHYDNYIFGGDNCVITETRANSQSSLTMNRPKSVLDTPIR